MASANITFDSIPASIRKPGQYFEFNTKLAVRTLPGNEQTVLIVGQRLTSGTMPALQAVEVFSSDQAAVYFGRGSIAHRAATAAITANPYLQLSVIALDDATAGVVATGAVAYAGTATIDSALTLMIANTRVDIAVSSGDTADVIAARFVAQIGNLPDLPITATAATGTLTLTAKNKGAAGNAIVLQALRQTAGITVTVTAFTGGQNDPDIAPALAAVFGASYDIYACSYPTQTALTTLRAHLDAISGPLEQRGAIGVAATPGTLATSTTLASQINEGRITLGWHPGSSVLPSEIAAIYAAVIASEEDPARPLNTLPLLGLDVTDISDQPSRTEQENALHNGVTPFEVGPGGIVQIVRAISTYTKNAEGIDDPALLDITTIRTLDYTRKACRQRIALRFPREKLSEKTPPKVRSELLDVLHKLEDLEILQNVDANKNMLICELDEQVVGRLDAAIPAAVVPGLHIFAGRIDLLL